LQGLRLTPYNQGVRLIAKSFLVAWMVVAVAWLPVARGENQTPDTDQSTRLTDFLHSHRLPLVGAQVLKSPTGGQSVLLYGYTATELGKSNAEKRTHLFLRDSEIPITNRIRVRPELASMRAPSMMSPSSSPPPEVGAQSPPPGAGAEPPPPDQLGDTQNYQNYQNQQAETGQQQYANQQAQQYMNQQNSTSSMANMLIPLIGMGLAIGMGGGGSGFGMGMSPGFGSPNPYGGYGSPYGGGYGYPNPYGPSPYGVPGTGNPYP
jgi:hypothetical protein